ncbi:MAG: hypothetical protein L6Q71_05640, partial [Planctomycetes bacterium]|nr:hypothetical protein [Planctomycetota bacterium]
MKRLIGLVVLIASMACLSGCASTRIEVSVNSITAEGVVNGKGTQYILLAGNEGESIHELQFVEYANYVKAALDEQGFVPAESFERADIAIFLSYGIGDAQTHNYTYSLPTWGQTGVSASNTTGTVNVYRNSASYQSQTTYTPTYGVTGHSQHSGSYTTYTRYATLDAWDLKKFRDTKDEQQLWVTAMVSTGRSNDLRRVFPVMIAAAAPHLGVN